MATKSANLYARIEPAIKDEAEGILAALGIPASNAISMFYRQVILHKGLPFNVTLPEPPVPDMSAMTQEELNAEIDKGYQDILAGRVTGADEVFRGIRGKHGL